jgi:hypothetical protein
MSRWSVELRGTELHVTHEHDGVAFDGVPSTDGGFKYAECSKCGMIRVIIPGDEREARTRAGDADGGGERDDQ